MNAKKTLKKEEREKPVGLSLLLNFGFEDRMAHLNEQRHAMHQLLGVDEDEEDEEEGGSDTLLTPRSPTTSKENVGGNSGRASDIAEPGSRPGSSAGGGAGKSASRPGTSGGGIT
eukprot:CAMPEP_0114142962 /NCGR_PEP_ID=MMETSP0043_2-20121206/18728_1 /TAXON_ID=464988 /ORGANISM="Hemiselmis andersenii, Strain CCMP644" /LENGTH=114 /DNA_ID=CAMNT_0001237219 /DNA_START=44 /DNA_END=385 /DNA_ORIENTATION=+